MSLEYLMAEKLAEKLVDQTEKQPLSLIESQLHFVQIVDIVMMVTPKETHNDRD